MGLVLILLFAALFTGAMLSHPWPAAMILGGVAILLTLEMLLESATAMETLLRALECPKERRDGHPERQ
jgi:hypothetical protein